MTDTFFAPFSNSEENKILLNQLRHYSIITKNDAEYILNGEIVFPRGIAIDNHIDEKGIAVTSYDHSFRKVPFETLARFILRYYVYSDAYTHSIDGIGKSIKFGNKWFRHSDDATMIYYQGIGIKTHWQQVNQNCVFVPKEVSTDNYRIYNFYDAIEMIRKNEDDIQGYLEHSKSWVAIDGNVSLNEIFGIKWFRIKPNATLTLMNGEKIPVPIEPKSFDSNKKYYVATACGHPIHIACIPDSIVEETVKMGLVHETLDAAEIHSQALLKFNLTRAPE